MSDRTKDLTWRFGVIAGLRKAMRQMTNAHEPELMETLPGRASAVLPNGSRIASVAIDWDVNPVIVNEDALVEHVRATRPDEVIEVVRPSYLRYLLEEAARNGEELPGVLLRDSFTITTTLARGCLENITRALESGEIRLTELLEPPDEASGPLVAADTL
ncbi:hypothetical protein [Actinomadura litoris]|uniref:hypothetical protein n=1 Tax=Actinomadura litoris TaxID=2678616 RepID=UPI001FA6FC59|nr:hypothetical protein [Actinomadura litoris]